MESEDSFDYAVVPLTHHAVASERSGILRRRFGGTICLVCRVVRFP